ncbi:hypothetical protein PHYPSEUDO_008009 [Phytophthora pseudosyringae]|uniref:Ankyrin repeat protein n=1 Tax=Phytophthora pseudosyringae TaxID=221518 RepID=A0A8T1VKI2_9STRA|nr:hypothetical protein PHYPSEUDO_008009 [Phytophthora pseudosyringae]
MLSAEWLDGCEPAGDRFSHVGGERVLEGCKTVSAVMKAKFATPALICEQTYLTYPSRPDFVIQEYGSASFKERTENENRERVFCDLMTMMKNSNGTLGDTDLNHLKTEIKKDPELLGMVSPCVKQESYPNDLESDLWSLLHQAAAGPAHNLYLVEWMIQMGALFNQPLHRRKNVKQGATCKGVVLPNTMAVHCAAIAGHENICRSILEADNMIDLNTPTFYSKETLAHLAVKNGHKSLYGILSDFGADFSSTDINKKSVCDVTEDQEWRSEIVAIIVERKKAIASAKDERKRNKLIRGQSLPRAEKLRKLVCVQRDEEHEEAVNSNRTQMPRSSKTKNKVAKGGNIKGHPGLPYSSTVDADSTKLDDLMDGLLVSSSVDEKIAEDASARNAELNDLFNNAAASFLRLRDSGITADQKTDDGLRACKLIIELEILVKFLSHPHRLDATDPPLRVFAASKSFETIHMMQRLHRAQYASDANPILTQVGEFCDTTLTFANFVVGTAQLLASLDRDAQTREMLDVLEKRLVKSPFSNRKASHFRELVQTYSAARDALGMGCTSSPDRFRTLEWYLSNVVENFQLQTKPDGMVGYLLYFVLMTMDDTTGQQFEQFEGVSKDCPELNRVVFTDRKAVFGGSSNTEIGATRELVLGVADRAGIQLNEKFSQPCVPALQLGAFMFSAAGVFRNASAA